MGGTLIVPPLDIWQETNPFFVPFEDYNGGIVTLGDGSLTLVKGNRSTSIIGYPKLDGFLYVDGLNANLLIIGQIYDKDHRVNFC